MKNGLLIISLCLFSFAGYANQCSEYWHKGNYEKAFTPCKEEAEQGNADAQYILAYMYEEGVGTKQDKQKAFYWYTKAAEQGHPHPQHNLAIMYYQGEDIEQDKQKAFYWYTKAAEQGD
ncbi:tetratricopeptide repeat protein, partial [Frischella perrara]|uniref:tetratricopeptide repeat protein n=1 Tax=Frischella perrara TaxID=1267021 RepID=UPI0023F2CB21